jgi:hypothetical protein
VALLYTAVDAISPRKFFPEAAGKISTQVIFPVHSLPAFRAFKKIRRLEGYSLFMW